MPVRIPAVVELALGQGLTAGLDVTLRKRIRLTNGLAVFAALTMFASIPFDRVNAPCWMIGEDLLGGLAFLLVPLLNRLRLHRLSRVSCLFLADLIVLGNAALLGRDSGAAMVFIAIAAVPFALFDLRERVPLISGVLLAVVSFVVAESDLLARFQSLSDNYSAPAYHIYSGAVTLTVLLVVLLQTARANARAERELRDNRQTAIYSAKMAALGEMSGNIAHEVNNPLAAILLRAQRLCRMGEGDRLDHAQVLKTGRDIEKTATRIARISTPSAPSPATSRRIRCAPRACRGSSPTPSRSAPSDCGSTPSTWRWTRSHPISTSSAAASRSPRSC
jgi:signal transduction histidine kinase